MQHSNRTGAMRHSPRAFSYAERKANLCCHVQRLAMRVGLSTPWQLNNLISLAVEKLDAGCSAATALDETRKIAERLTGRPAYPH